MSQALVPDTRKNTEKISAGVVIRKITSYLYTELMRIIKEYK
jgi:hypothetical protein